MSQRKRPRRGQKEGQDVVHQQEEDEDEVYQYAKTGSGPVFAAIENILRW